MPTGRPPLAFRIRGMDCADEVAALRREVAPVVGGEECLSFDILSGKMTVSSLPAEVTQGDVLEAVSRTGMSAEPWTEASGDAGAQRGWQSWERVVLTIASGVATGLAAVLHVWLAGGFGPAFGEEGAGVAHLVPLPAMALYAAAIVCGAWFVAPKAWHAMRSLRPDMNLLMLVAVSGAAAISEWFEAATVSFLFALSLLLESWNMGRARRAIAALLDLSPPTARIHRDDGTLDEVPPEQVPIGATVLVAPGERIPLDGRVVEGTSHINQAPITGESQPVEKQVGSDVFAGTINGDGALAVECTKPADDTTLARIIRMVGEAQSRRAPSEQWVEKFARVYTPTVMGLALMVLIVPPLVLRQPWNEWLYNSLVLLVIACPCAMVISTPVTIMAALTAAAGHGVLIKGGVNVEAPSRLTAIALDKTGTLTAGRPAVADVVPLNGHTENEVIERAAAMEARSDHPIAQAIVRCARERRIEPAPAEGVQNLQGKGMTGRFDGRDFWVGSHRYLEERGQETPEIHQQLESLSAAGRTIVVVGNEQHVCGLIAIADQVRPHARATLEELHREGIEHLIMLTGDNEPTARAIAAETGVDEVEAELLPADKVTAIERLVDKYQRVAMVGDGVNDAPALARATIGIAMGAAGSDAAIETSDIALMSDDLSRLPWLIRHSRRTLAVIRQNISFSLAIKALFVMLTFTGQASLWAAIAVDMGASLLVIFNGLRLLHDAPGGQAHGTRSYSPVSMK
jgi:Zn2+/Cd2+-exporting ATPase